MPDKTIAKDGGWYAGRDQEWFTVGPMPTRECAIAEGKALFDEGFFIIEAEKQKLRFDAARLIEDQYLEAVEFFGEDGEPERFAGSEAADKELQSLLDEWTRKHQNTFAQFNLFAWTANEEFIPGEGG